MQTTGAGETTCTSPKTSPEPGAGDFLEGIDIDLDLDFSKVLAPLDFEELNIDFDPDGIHIDFDPDELDVDLDLTGAEELSLDISEGLDLDEADLLLTDN